MGRWGARRSCLWDLRRDALAMLDQTLLDRAVLGRDGLDRDKVTRGFGLGRLGNGLLHWEGVRHQQRN